MSHYTSPPAEFTLGKIRILCTGGQNFAKLTFRMAGRERARTRSGPSKRVVLLQAIWSCGHLKRFGNGPMNIGTSFPNMLRFDVAYQIYLQCDFEHSEAVQLRKGDFFQ
jgi:hypothetical protein